MKIRKGKIEDWEEIYKILNSSKELAQTGRGEQYSKLWVKWTLKERERNWVLICEENREIIGFLIAELWRNEKYVYVGDIFVKKEFRQKGVASELIKELEIACKKNKIKVISMLVNIKNKSMQSFISAKGYEQGNKFYWYEKKLLK